MRLFVVCSAVASTVLVALSGCNGPAERPASAPTTTAPPAADSVAPAPPTERGQPVSLTGHTFRFRAFALNSGDPNAVPKFGIYLYPSQLTDSVLVAEDTEPNALERGQWADLGVPKEAVSMFQTYYAGAGNQYYAVTEGNRLRIFRKPLEEATPQNEHTPLPQWQSFKTFAFFSDGVRPE